MRSCSAVLGSYAQVFQRLAEHLLRVHTSADIPTGHLRLSHPADCLQVGGNGCYGRCVCSQLAYR